MDSVTLMHDEYSMKKAENLEVVGETDEIRFVVLDTPGHTLDHISIYFPMQRYLFAGDTLFSLGCGRLFEGTPRDMYKSLSMLSKLPDDTLLYCGHEYTLSNAKFALSVDPTNVDLKKRVETVKSLRDKGKPTVPVTFLEEKLTNPFLRCDSAEIKANIGLSADSSGESTFELLRNLKDNF